MYDLIHPGTGRIFSSVFGWVINFVQRMLRTSVMRENENGSVEDKQEQEQERGTLNAEKER